MSFVANPNTCFDSIIVLDNLCSGAIPTSGIYASSAGITRSYLSQIITKDFQNEESFFNAKLSIAIENVANDVHSFFQNKYKAVSVINNFRAGVILENKVAISATSKYKGILFNINDEDTGLDLFVSEISLFVNYTGNIDIKVFDLIEGRVIDTIPITTVAGRITTIYPLVKFQAQRKKQQLYFCYDATGIDSYNTVIRERNCNNCSDSYIENSYERIGSFTLGLSESAIISNLVASSDTGGMSIVNSLQCNHSLWLCSINNLLAFPILYKTASLIHEHALLVAPNTRFNTTEGNNAELIQKSLDASEFKYKEWMDNKLHSINMPLNDTCFQCKSTSEHVVVLP